VKTVHITKDNEGRPRFKRRPLWGFTPVLDLEVHEADDLIDAIRAGRNITNGAMGDLYFPPRKTTDDQRSMVDAYRFCHDADRRRSAWFHPSMDAFWEECEAEDRERREEYHVYLADVAAGRVSNSVIYRNLVAEDWARRKRQRREELERERREWIAAKKREAQESVDRSRRWRREEREWSQENERKNAEQHRRFKALAEMVSDVDIRSEEGRAAIVELWITSIHTQKEIALALGYSNATFVNQVIMRFCVKWAPEKTRPRYYDADIVLPTEYGEQRRMLAKKCLERYRARRDSRA
jgi:hypothetical protein